MYLTHASSAIGLLAPGPGAMLLLLDKRAAPRTQDRVLDRQRIDVDANGTVTVSPEIAALLDLPDGEPAVDPVGNLPTFSAARRRQRAEPVTIDPNVPKADQRFMPMKLEDLLQEVAQRVAGFGPPDKEETLNPATPPWTRREGDIEVALMYAPNREHDRLRLKAAVSHLDPMFHDHHRLVHEIRQRRPDLEPVLERWSADVLAPALAAALRAPLRPDGSPQAVFGALFEQINEPSSHSYDYYVPQLEQRMVASHQSILADKLTRFFRFLSTPVPQGKLTDNGVLGAAKNLREGSDVRRLLRSGMVVFRCTQEQLREHLQMVPAARVKVVSLLGPQVARVGLAGVAHYATTYPRRGRYSSIEEVFWQDLSGVEQRVLVVNHRGVHSYSIDGGLTWRPTGGITSRAMDEVRADGWRQFFADRWHEHRHDALAHLPSVPGR